MKQIGSRITLGRTTVREGQYHKLLKPPHKLNSFKMIHFVKKILYNQYI